ncbi:MAG: prolyl oligopeptidase family serine peptidase [Candidatus Kapaibacterium sp.]
MKKLLPLFLALILMMSPAFAEKMTTKKLFELKRISDHQISPDGDRMIFSISAPDVEANTFLSDIYTMPIKGGDMYRITRDGKSHGGRWSPDGKKIVFLSSRDGKSQVYVLDLKKGGDAVKMTDMENGCQFASWSPDGKWIAFVSDVKLGQTPTEQNPELSKMNVRVYDDLPVRHWDRWQDVSFRHLFVIPADGGEPRDLMPGEKFDTPLMPFGGASQIAWSPNGTEIAYTAKKVDNFEESTNSDIYRVPVHGGSAVNITRGNPGFDMDPLYSPDGKYIAFHSQERPGFESDRIRLMLYRTSSARIEELSKNLDQWVTHSVWAPDSRSLYFTAGHNDGTMQIYTINLNGKFKTLTSGTYDYGNRGLAVTPDGKTLVFSRENYNEPSDIYSMPAAGGESRKLTDINKEVMKNVDKATIQSYKIKSFDDAEVQTWVVLPPNFDKSKKYPLITYCQGGPQQQVSQYWSFGWNFLTMASEGYIVVAPNRRGTPGFGQDWVDAISKDYGGAAMQDILAATDSIASMPYVDKNRLSAIGASAGGYATFWLAGNHEGRFSAFVSHCGVFNLASMYGSTEELWFPNWDNGGPYWKPENKKYYAEHSPHSYVQNWDTPILIITGEYDFRVPYSQSLEAFTAAQVQGVPSRLIVYPEEIHWITRPQDKIFWYREFFRFLGIHSK